MMNESLIINELNYSSIKDEVSIGNLINSSQFGTTVCVIWSILVVLGVIGNGLVIVAGIKYKKLEEPINCYIINLAITDFLFALFCIPFTIYIYSADNWIFGKVLCKMSHFFSRVKLNMLFIGSHQYIF
jgi:hypothetical protein